MYSRLSLGFPLFATLSLCAAADSARAAEGYLCGANTVVYVEPQDLELKKRTDPCIASYYGLHVDAVAEPKPTPSPKSAPAKTSKATPVAKLRPSVGADASAAVRAPRVRHASAVIAAPDTDYRNVRVLNPETPEEAVYRHTK